jgi:hypothetical protein
VEGYKARGFAVVREALEAMDEARLGGAEGVAILEKNAPKEEDKAKAKAYPPDQVPLFGMAESFVYEMGKVTNYTQRVKCLVLKATFSELYAVVEKDVSIFSGACHEIVANPKLVEFLVDVVRPFGNALNAGSRKENAAGIKVSSLEKLAQTKTADNSMTSLYFIVSVLDKHRPHLLALVNEFKACRDAVKLQQLVLDQNLKVVRDAAKYVEDAVAAATTADDFAFLEAIEPFSQRASAMTATMVERCDRFRADFERVCRYLAEDPAAVKPEDLFKEWSKFIDVFLQTVQLYRANVDKAEKKRKADEAKAAKEREKARAAAHAADGSGKQQPRPPPARGKLAAPQGLAAGGGRG